MSNMRKENENTEKIDLDKKMPEMVAAYQSAPSDTIKNEMFEKILRDCMSLINYTVKLIAYQPPLTKEEIKQQAIVEFFHCISKYKPVGKKKFTSYVITYIKMKLIKYVRKNQQIVNVSNHLAEKNAKIRKIEREFEKEHNRPMAREELEKHGITSESYYHYKTYGTAGWDNIDDYQIPDENNVTDKLANQEMIEQIMQEVEKFKEDYKYIFEQRVIHNKTFEEIAEEMGCSRQNVHGKFVKMQKRLSKFKQ